MTSSERQALIRIKLSVYAYAYEYLADSLIPDEEYDKLSRQVDLSIPTSNKTMDKFFRKEFDPDTGVWIRKHPNKLWLQYLYDTYYKKGDNK